MHAYAFTRDTPALAYVRPHDIDIQKEFNGQQPAFSAVVSYIHSLGHLVRLELQRDDHTVIVEAELTQAIS